MKNAAMAQVVEHILGKDEVGSSSLPSSSKEKALALQVPFLLYAYCGCPIQAPSDEGAVIFQKKND